MMGTHRGTLAAAAAFVGLMLGVACVINPVTGKRELVLVSEAQEIEMGRQGSADVITGFGLHPDAGLQSYVSLPQAMTPGR